MNSEFDTAVTAMGETHWYQKVKSQKPKVELQSAISWWKDDWTYGQVIDTSDPKWNPIEFRYRPSTKNHASTIQRKTGSGDAGWRNVE